MNPPPGYIIYIIPTERPSKAILTPEASDQKQNNHTLSDINVRFRTPTKNIKH